MRVCEERVQCVDYHEVVWIAWSFVRRSESSGEQKKQKWICVFGGETRRGGSTHV